MIREIELKNIRIFREELKAKFPLSKLSVFCGTNNSGKSTILRSLLLLRQTQINSGEASGGRLRFVGSQVDLGNYTSYVTDKDSNKDITISLMIEDAIPVEAFLFLQSLSTSNSKDAILKKIQSDKTLKYWLKSSFIFTAKKLEVEEQFSEDDYSTIKGILKSVDYEMIVEEEKILSWRVQISDKPQEDKVGYEILIPKKYFEKLKGNQLMELERSKDDNFLIATTILKGILPFRIASKKSQGISWSFPLPPVIEEALKDFYNALDRMHYLAPLRIPARRYYLTRFDFLPGLDPAGEFLPYILREKEREVWNVRPGKQERVKEKLSTALNVWLYYLRVGKEPSENVDSEEIVISSLKGALVEIEIKTIRKDEKYPLADSGFGYSQVLPILVRGLLASPFSTMIVEQPELHLNPALQVRLVEFFIAMVHADKQVIIETHSEHIVNMIRVLIAEDESKKLSADSSIFFIDAEEQIPIIYDLSIKPDGTVSEWPYKFFGEAASLSGRLLRAQKRYRESAKKNSEGK